MYFTSQFGQSKVVHVAYIIVLELQLLCISIITERVSEL